MLPMGFTPHQHFLCGLAAASPRCASLKLAHDLEYAITKTIELGDRARYWRKKGFLNIQTQCAASETEENLKLDAERSYTHESHFKARIRESCRFSIFSHLANRLAHEDTVAAAALEAARNKSKNKAQTLW